MRFIIAARNAIKYGNSKNVSGSQYDNKRDDILLQELNKLRKHLIEYNKEEEIEFNETHVSSIIPQSFEMLGPDVVLPTIILEMLKAEERLTKSKKKSTVKIDSP